MSTAPQQKAHVDGTRLGECSAMQPLSGVKLVDETFAVNGTGRGGYARTEETMKPEALPKA